MSMRFTSLELHEIRIPFRFSYKHSLAERSEARNLLVILKTAGGQVGYGEVLPRDYLTGETVESAWDDIASTWWPMLRDTVFDDRVTRMVPREGKNESWDLKPGTTYAFFDQLKPMYEKADAERKTASYAGIDIAATDAWASATSRPGCSIFGQQPPVKVPLVAPIGGGTVKKVSRLANAFKWLGFREFKLKTGQDDDAARLRAVRKAIGPDAILWVDANAAWSLDDALAMRDILKETNVSFIEQPCPACHPETLAHIQQGLGIPVMADESLCTRADAEEMLRRDIKIWNVRLAKIGGYSGMLEMLRLAGEHSVKLYLGILVGETSAMAAAQRACLGLAKFFHVEYGFPRVLLKSDPFREGPAGYFGHCSPLGSNPGLGVRLLPDVLEQVSVRKITLR